MTPGELRSRIARSRVSGRRLARALGVAQQQVTKWCQGVRPIPDRHVPAIIELTDIRQASDTQAWRPPAGMPPGRSTGFNSLAAKQRRAARADRLPSSIVTPPRQAVPVAWPPRRAPHREPAPTPAPAQGLDWSAMAQALASLRSLVPPIDGNGAYSGEPVAQTVMQGNGALTRRRARQAPQRAPQFAQGTVAGMTGQSHADFVREQNAASQRGELPAGPAFPLIWFRPPGKVKS